MSLWVDIEFTNRLGPYLRNFKQKKEYLWNFSCCVCGDSKTNAIKARGYIYRSKTGLFVKCHNCGYSVNLGNFIKLVDPNLYTEYTLEKYKNDGAPRSSHKDLAQVPEIAAMRRDPLTDDILDPIVRCDQLGLDHPVVKYLNGRSIRRNVHHLLYVAPQFKKFVNTVIDGKFRHLDDDHPRLIIPYFNEHGKCFAFQGRSFGNEEPKYYSIKVDPDATLIFGLERVNYARRIFIVEGPLDSLFLPNSLAVSGSTFNTPVVEALRTNSTIVFDNEPRSREITKLISKCISKGFAVCLWPESVQEKDINEMVISGRTPMEIVDLIKSNTFQGAAAKLRFATWRKCELQVSKKATGS